MTGTLRSRPKTSQPGQRSHGRDKKKSSTGKDYLRPGTAESAQTSMRPGSQSPKLSATNRLPRPMTAGSLVTAAKVQASGRVGSKKSSVTPDSLHRPRSYAGSLALTTKPMGFRIELSSGSMPRARAQNLKPVNMRVVQKRRPETQSESFPSTSVVCRPSSGYVNAARTVTPKDRRESFFDDFQHLIASTRKLSSECIEDLDVLQRSSQNQELASCTTILRNPPATLVVRRKSSLIRRRRGSTSKPSSLNRTVTGGRILLRPPSLKNLECVNDIVARVTSPTASPASAYQSCRMKIPSPQLSSPKFRYLPGVGMRCVRMDKLRTTAYIREVSPGRESHAEGTDFENHERDCKGDYAASGECRRNSVESVAHSRKSSFAGSADFPRGCRRKSSISSGSSVPRSRTGSFSSVESMPRNLERVEHVLKRLEKKKWASALRVSLSKGDSPLWSSMVYASHANSSPCAARWEDA